MVVAAASFVIAFPGLVKGACGSLFVGVFRGASESLAAETDGLTSRAVLLRVGSVLTRK